MKINIKLKNSILRQLFISLSILFISRIGIFFPIPELNSLDLIFYSQNFFFTQTYWIISLCSLNIFPYINANILIQFGLNFVIDSTFFIKEKTIENYQKIKYLTYFITFILTIIQSFYLSNFLKNILLIQNSFLILKITIWLTIGSMLIIWFSELINKYGLGNGISLMIYLNIISNIPIIYKRILLENKENFNIYSKLLIILIVLITLYGIIFLEKGIKTIPLISSQELNQIPKSYLQNINNYISLKYNYPNIMPMVLSIINFIDQNYLNIVKLWIKNYFTIDFIFLNFFYWITYFFLILFFNNFYSKIFINPKNISNQLKNMTITILNLQPGISTIFYLDELKKRILLIGSILLFTLIFSLNYLISQLHIKNFNGLIIISLLILASGILEIILEINTIYYSNIYNFKYKKIKF